MTTKIYWIPIRGQEQIALGMIEAICASRNFVPSSNELTSQELMQEKLNFVGVLAGKLLRESAESYMKMMEQMEANRIIEEKYKHIGDLLEVLPVEVEDEETQNG